MLILTDVFQIVHRVLVVLAVVSPSCTVWAPVESISIQTTADTSGSSSWYSTTVQSPRVGCIAACWGIAPISWHLLHHFVFSAKWYEHSLNLFVFLFCLPVKNWVVGFWHGYLSGARCRLAYDAADATATHCLLLQQKSRLVLPFWYWLTRAVPNKGPWNGCVCVCPILFKYWLFVMSYCWLLLTVGKIIILVF